MLEKIKQEWRHLKEHCKQVSNRRLQRKLLEIERQILMLRAEEVRRNENKIFAFNNHFDGYKYLDIPEIQFYLPQALSDTVQSNIVKSGDFFDVETIERSNKYFKDIGNILDIGANIGNNSIYYAMIRNAKKVYAFEPIYTTYEILQKNIKLNSLEDKIQAYNFALGEKEGKVSVSCSPLHNVGATILKDDEQGGLLVKSLNELQNQGFFGEKIDFIKIDVEGFEDKVLKGADEFLRVHSPTIAIEIFSKNFSAVHAILLKNSYQMVEKIGAEDYIFQKIKF